MSQASPAVANAEVMRLAEDQQRAKNWKRWGPYLSDRQWGTVREDYSADGNCWDYFPHDHARSRAYRWGEDGLLGITDRECRLCFSLALWNGRDPILKERLFGLTNPQGNHGEDVKECYYHLDASPTNSYLKALYKYPQAEFPYEQLVSENKRRDQTQREFELTDTGVFNEGRYFDVFVEYAKASSNDILIRITVENRGPEAARIHLLPTLWFRNTWSWGHTSEDSNLRPRLSAMDDHTILAEHETLGRFRGQIEPASSKNDDHGLLFTENDSNGQRLCGQPNGTEFVKDGFHDRVIHDQTNAINPARTGTKAAAWREYNIPAGGRVVMRLRLSAESELPAQAFGDGFDRVFIERLAETDAFYAALIPNSYSDDQRHVARAAYAGLIWSKQFYHYVVKDWLRGDPAQPSPPANRLHGRNADWSHLFNRDVISLPDKWEYPWYAAWDLAFHMIPFARIDPAFAKEQLLLLLREWYMHPNGQMPAYEFNFSDVNPPVHAWAVWRVYKMSAPRGQRDRQFLARAFHKLLINFTWWVNRKDPQGNHIFAGGFLGLDNIGVFDRSKPLPTGGHLEQADGTAWMAFYCSTMLAIALELASEDPTYDDVASKFFEHFVAIADAINTLGGTGLWDETDGFYYDQLHLNDRVVPLKIRSLVGLIPLLAVLVLEREVVDQLPGFLKRTQWFLKHRTDLGKHISYMEQRDHNGKSKGQLLLAIPSRERLHRVLGSMLDEQQFLSPFGIRAVTKDLEKNPFIFNVDGEEHRVDYTPGESTSGLFGGNSNWRGPIWFPVNYLLIESLERFHYYYGDDFKVECPVGSGQHLSLDDVAGELRRRLTTLFLPDQNGRRPCHGDDARCALDPHWRDLVLFHEYFHADTGRGLGASHQTGWTALVAQCLEGTTAGTYLHAAR